MCTPMLMHAIAHGDCMDTVRESVLEDDTRREKNLLHLGLEPGSVVSLAFQLNAQVVVIYIIIYICLFMLTLLYSKLLGIHGSSNPDFWCSKTFSYGITSPPTTITLVSFSSSSSSSSDLYRRTV